MSDNKAAKRGVCVKALITGASSGIGRDMARILSKMGYDLILVARREERMEELSRELKTDIRIISTDLSDPNACFTLYEQVKSENIGILINNAGFGLFGAFEETDLSRELEMLDVNIRAVHILTKLFLRDFLAKDAGYILNVASSAAFLPGPLFSSYYATKAYVLRLTEAIWEELRRKDSHIYVGVLCPGPVRTEFDNVAGVKFSLESLNSEVVAAYAVKKMFKKKLIIMPGAYMRILRAIEKPASEKLLLRAAYYMQRRKKGKG